MPREFSRNVRVAEAIRRLAAPEIDALARAAGLGMVTVTEVEVTNDLALACIYVSVYTNADSTTDLGALRQAIPQLRSKIAHDLRLKKMPRISLEWDKSVARGARISQLLSRPARHD